MARAGFGSQLRTLLWKNYLLKRRSWRGTLAEILVPLFLFVLMAWVRTRETVTLYPDTTYNTLALPSSGALALVQSILCGGIANFDSPNATGSPLEDVAAVLDRYQLTPEVVLGALANTALDEADLNQTLREVGLINTSVGLADLTDLWFGTNATYWDGLYNLSQSASGNDTQAVVNAVCRLVNDPDLAALVANLTQTNLTAVADDIQLPGFDLGAILRSPDPAEEFLRQYVTTNNFINVTVVDVLHALNGTLNGTITPEDVAIVQNQLRADAANHSSLAEMRSNLLIALAREPALERALVAVLLGLEDPAERQAVLDALAQASGTNISTSMVPVLLDEFARLEADLGDLSRIEAALQDIEALPTIDRLLDDLQRNGSNLDWSTLYQQIACPNTDGIAVGGSFSFRSQGSGYEPNAATNEPRPTNAPRVAERTRSSSSGEPSNPSRRRRASEPTMAHDREDTSSQDVEDEVTVGLDAMANSEQLLELFTQAQVYYAPARGQVLEVIGLANATLQQAVAVVDLVECVLASRLAANITASPANFTWLDNLTSSANSSALAALQLDDFWVGFDTEEELVAAAMGDDKLFTVFGGVVFHDVDDTGRLPNNLSLSIRFHQLKTPSTAELAPAYTWNNAGDTANALYYYLGFTIIQDLMERATLEFWAGESVGEPAVYAQMMPVPAYRDDLFAWGISRTLPLFMVLSWIYFVTMLAKNIVHEKETRLKEYTKMMGLSELVHWVGWFLSSLVVLTVTCFLMTVVLVGGNVFAFSDPLLIFVYLEISAIASIMVAFIISTLFSKARIAAAVGGMIYFGTYMPYVFVSIQEETMTAGTKWGLSLFSTTAFGMGAAYIARYEEIGEGLQWHNMGQGIGACDNFTFSNALIMMIFDCFLYALLVWYLEQVLTPYGVAQPWYFPFQRKYWTGLACFSSRRASAEGQSLIAGKGSPALQQNNPAGHFQAVPDGQQVGIRLDKLTKVYRTGACSDQSERVAVDQLSFEMATPGITALLGHNGAGKTTTMSILTGLFPPTSGTAYIDGLDVRTQMGTIREHLGVCPQYNVIFETLTVEENLIMVARLRCLSPTATLEAVDRYINDVRLNSKRFSLAGTLSGGQKRKLSVAMAFLSGSNVVILDEPTAGCDASVRRSMWDLLLRYKKERTILLCTHHLDEADLLSDAIAIMAHGRLQCLGTSMFLKKAYNATYLLSAVVDRTLPDVVPRISQVIRKHVPKAELADDVGQEVAFHLPVDQVAGFAPLFCSLDAQRAELGIESYGLSATTLEDVFLRVAEDAEESEERTTRPATMAAAVKPERSETAAQSVDARLSWSSGMDASLEHSLLSQHDDEEAEHGALVQEDGTYTGRLLQGWPLRAQRFKAVLLKRWHNVRRDFKAFLSQIVLPAIFICVGMAVATSFPPPKDGPPLEFAPDIFNVPCHASLRATETPYADLHASPSLLSSTLTASVSVGFDPDYFIDVGGTDALLVAQQNFSAYILDTYDELQATRRAALTIESTEHPVVQLSSALLSGAFNSTVMRGWFDNRHYHSLPTAVHLAHNAILHSTLGSTHNLRVFNHPLNSTADEKTQEYLESGTDLTVAINVIMALSFVPASFVVFLISERVSKAKHLQMVSGLDLPTYWVANFTWDMLNYTLPALVALLIFVAFDLPAYTGRNLGAVTALLFLYGWSITPIMYLGSFLFKVPSTGYVVLICVNLFIGLTATLATFILGLFPDDPGLTSVNDSLKWVFLIFPNYCLGRGMMDLAANEYIAQFYEYSKEFIDNAPSYQDPFSMSLIGRNCMFMVLEGLIFLVLTIAIEHWRMRQRLRQSDSSASTPSNELEMLSVGLAGEMTDPSDLGDEDVRREQERVRAGGTELVSEAVLVADRLVKTYTGKNGTTRAVRGLSFVVPRGQCFGLLGTNGAGKTTTFKMITGDVACTSGNAFVAGHSILKDMAAVRQHEGYCPQEVDALNGLLTGQETLEMYCRLRGIPESQLGVVVDWSIRKMQLRRWAKRIAQVYSGGNKRKLSIAIALLGQSSLVCLDEPSAGLDPRARRFLWTQINGVVRAGRSVILTSHAMDECQALCQRLGIMVDGQFRCLGSPQHLKSKYGNGYTLAIKVQGFPPEVGPAKSFVAHRFPTAVLKEAHNGLLRYQLPTEGLVLATIFTELEAQREALNLEDYAITQTTLEDIFCSFADLAEDRRTAQPGDDQPSSSAPWQAQEEHRSSLIPATDEVFDEPSTALVTPDSLGGDQPHVSVLDGLAAAEAADSDPSAVDAGYLTIYGEESHSRV